MKFKYDGLAEPVERQVNKKGYTLGPDAERVEIARQAIFTLMFQNILSEKQVSDAWERLDKKVLGRLVKVEI